MPPGQNVHQKYVCSSYWQIIVPDTYLITVASRTLYAKWPRPPVPFMGKRTRWRHHKAQASSSKSTDIGTLQPHPTYSTRSGRLTLGIRSSIATAATRFHLSTNCLWKPLTHRCWDEIRTTWKQISHNRIWLWTLPPISVWKKLWARNQPPPTWTHFQDKDQPSRQIQPRQSRKMGSATSRVWLQGSLPSWETQPGWLIVLFTHKVTME